MNSKVEVKVPRFSGFNLSHRNTGTETCGTLTPLLIEEVAGNSRVSLKVNIVTQLPPLVSDTYMNVRKKVEAFYVPFRLLTKSFEPWYSDVPVRYVFRSSSAQSQTFINCRAALPVFLMTAPIPLTSFGIGRGSLLDYLGFKVDAMTENILLSPLSLIAYHLVWQEFYRNPRVQNPAFAPSIGVDDYKDGSHSFERISALPFTNFHDSYSAANIPAQYVIPITSSHFTETSFGLADGVSIFSLRQRNFGFDPFTCATTSPQQGTAAEVSFDTSGDNASLTIAQLRAANSLQMFRERNNLPSSRYVDQLKARTGAVLSDGVAQRPIFIGSASYDVVSRGVDQTGQVDNGSNPFNSVASQYGRAFGAGSDFIIDDFKCVEPGFILVLQSLVPEVTYSTGVSPYLRRYLSPASIVEMPSSLLQNMGDEPIYSSELYAGRGSDFSSVFGYRQRYGSFMAHNNEVHGLMRESGDLDSFVLKRGFASVPVQGSQFLEIPKNYLDQVFAVASGVSGLSAWYDAKLDWRVSMPLDEYSIPSFQDPGYEHGRSVYLRRNGQVF